MTDSDQAPAESVPGTLIPAEALEDLPPLIREFMSTQGAQLRMYAQFAAASWTGPYPPPDLLKGYEEVAPGTADRLIKMAEEQQRHRHHLERIAVEGGSRRAWWGLWLGFAISLVVLALGTVIILTGHQWTGASVMGIDVVALAGVFVYGRHDQRRERQEKSAQTKLPPGSPGSLTQRDPGT